MGRELRSYVDGALSMGLDPMEIGRDILVRWGDLLSTVEVDLLPKRGGMVAEVTCMALKRVSTSRNGMPIPA